MGKPIPLHDRPKPPAALRAAQTALWETIVESFELESHHLRILEHALRELDRAEVAEEQVGREGLTVSDRYGGQRSHPAVSVARSSRLAAARLLRELGLEDDVHQRASRLPRTRGYRPYDRRS